MIFIVSKFLVRLLSFGSANAMALFPFVLAKEKNLAKYIINHEKIHLKQQLELLILPFYLWYIIEFLVLLVKYKNKKLAYINICFEKEAYQNHYNFIYRKKRKPYSFLAYYKK